MDRKLGLVRTFFRGGTPRTQGTLHVVKSLDVTRDEIDAMLCRSEGWPGQVQSHI